MSRQGIRPTIGYICAKSPRAEVWRKIFGDETIPLLSPLTVTVDIADIGEVEAYFVDVKKLEEAQLERLAVHLAQLSKEPVDNVRAALRKGAFVPVIADDVSVTFDGRLFL